MIFMLLTSPDITIDGETAKTLEKTVDIVKVHFLGFLQKNKMDDLLTYLLLQGFCNPQTSPNYVYNVIYVYIVWGLPKTL